MNRKTWKAGALAITLAVLPGGTAEAQWGYGWGGWGGYGGGGQTVQGDMARGMGALAVGAGQYNQQTAVARSVNADTAMRWNQYVYQSQQEANRRYHQRMAQKQYGDTKARDKIADRLRNDPEPRDIYSGDALNVAYDEINDPRVYAKALASAKVKVGGAVIRDIPFSYAAAAISTSIHQIMQRDGAPPSLKTPEFASLRTEMRPLAEAIRNKTDEGESPDRADVEKALKLIEAAEAKVETTYPANSRNRNEAMKYLKAVHGLLRMMETPAINVLLAGVEKHPDVTLGELLTFMNTFNLRFGPATSVRQREVYDILYPKLVKLRSDIAPALASAPSPSSGPSDSDAGELFSGMSTQDLKKRAVPPPPPAARP
jgi:hypothetical protein